MHACPSTRRWHTWSRGLPPVLQAAGAQSELSSMLHRRCSRCEPGHLGKNLPAEAHRRRVNNPAASARSHNLPACRGTLHIAPAHSYPLAVSQPASALPRDIDCKCSLNPIQMIHLHLSLPSAALATNSCVCKYCFPFIQAWPRS